jgi:hypothetical protein
MREKEKKGRRREHMLKTRQEHRNTSYKTKRDRYIIDIILQIFQILHQL